MPDTLPTNILAWDAVSKSYHARPNEESAEFTFSVTNVSPADVVIEETGTSCGCTMADLPETPWKLAPGSGGLIHATMDLNDKHGTVANTIVVFTSKGNQALTVTVIMPDE